MVNKINEQKFKAMDKTGISVIDFNATWCGPCKMLAPVLEELSEEMADQAKFYAIDTDESPALAQSYGIVSIPAVVVLKDGQKVDMNVGFVPKAQLKGFIEGCM